MAKLNANTVVKKPDGLDVVVLMAGDDVPEWAAGLIGDHLLAGPVTSPSDSGAGGTEESGVAASADTGGADGATPDASWTVADLRDYAKANNVDLDGATAKADILAAIKG